MKIQINTPSRIHGTLLDLEGSIGRIDGGIGFTLAHPNWDIEIESIDEPSVILESPPQVDEQSTRSLINDIIANLGIGSLQSGVKITIKDYIQDHVGLGSKTQLCLALADGISRLFNVKGVPFEKEKLAKIVRRGGTSGIGVTSYFQGGFIIDGGHSFGKGLEKPTFLPSSASNACPPPVLVREDMPGKWRIVCAIPSDTKGAHDAEEVNIFQEYCPIPLNEVEKLCHLLLMKLLPAIKLGEFNTVCSCINAIQGIGFKKIEVDLRGTNFKKLMKEWSDAGAPCVGMSSFGPLIYSLARSEEEALELKEKIDKIMNFSKVSSFITRFSNSGAKIKISGENEVEE
ncbi:MAG: beta-ribofuranosylaminobenzene 5'-phosphate synthase [Candidatus Hodarchaeota archaeon]